MRLSISEISTPSASFAEDLAAYRAAGCDGIGIWEFKLPADDGEARRLLRKSGLTATNCVPAVPSVLPAPGMDEPAEPEQRVELVASSIRRLAAYEPDCVVCPTGPIGKRDEREARQVVVEALRVLADVAAAAGVRLGLEPIHVSQRETLSFVNSIPDALEIIGESGRPSIGIMFDTYHVWDTPTVLDDIERHVARFTGVHIADWRDPPRSANDRALPGEGVANLNELVGALDRAGWDGPYDVEIFSDTELPDSLWGLSADELARRARQAFERVWSAR